MRRLNDITIEIGDRWQPSQPPRRGKPAPRKSAPPRPASRQKLRRRLPMFMTRRMRRALAVAAVALAVVGTPAWFFLSAPGKRLIADVRAQTLDLSARAGFRVADIYVEGRNRTPKQALITALAVERGDPILGIDLEATRQRLEAIPWIDKVTLERRLPDEIHLVVTERTPIALWQNLGRYYLVDHTGLVIGGEEEAEDLHPSLLIVGEGAPDHAQALLDLLHEEPTIARRVKAAQWISERRWNLVLDSTADGITVRLPEEGAAGALHDLARLDREQSLLERKVTLIDMRLPDRLVLRTTPSAETPAAATRAAPKGRQAAGRDT